MNPTKNLETLKIIASDMCSYLQDKLSDIDIVTAPRVISNKIVFTVDGPLPHYDSGTYENFRADIERFLRDKFASDEYTIDVKLRDKSGMSNRAWKTVITGVIVTLASTAKYEFENPLRSLSFRWGSSVKKTERVTDVTDVQRVMDSFVSLLNEKINWALEQPKKRLPVKGYILVNYKQELDDTSYFTPILVWECRNDKIYAAVVEAVGYEYETTTNKFRKIGTSLDLNLLDGSNLYDFTKHQFNLEYQGDVSNMEYVTESIYEQMNKIDDADSLNEKWNIKDVRELKTLKESGKSKITESMEDSFDIDKYYVRGNDEDAIRFLDDPDLAEYLIRCETVDSSFEHVCWLMARPEYRDALQEHELVELVGDATGEFPAIFVNDRVYDVTHDIVNYLGLDED